MPEKDTLGFDSLLIVFMVYNETEYKQIMSHGKSTQEISFGKNMYNKNIRTRAISSS